MPPPAAGLALPPLSPALSLRCHQANATTRAKRLVARPTGSLAAPCSRRAARPVSAPPGRADGGPCPRPRCGPCSQWCVVMLIAHTRMCVVAVSLPVLSRRAVAPAVAAVQHRARPCRSLPHRPTVPVPMAWTLCCHQVLPPPAPRTARQTTPKARRGAYLAARMACASTRSASHQRPPALVRAHGTAAEGCCVGGWARARVCWGGGVGWAGHKVSGQAVGHGPCLWLWLCLCCAYAHRQAAQPR